jgi:hypothetical protein
VKAGLIRLYVIDGETYGEIDGFAKFQAAGPNGRRIRKYPANPDSTPQDPAKSGSVQQQPEEPEKSSAPHTHTQSHTHSRDQANRHNFGRPRIQDRA